MNYQHVAAALLTYFGDEKVWVGVKVDERVILQRKLLGADVLQQERNDGSSSVGTNEDRSSNVR